MFTWLISIGGFFLLSAITWSILRSSKIKTTQIREQFFLSHRLFISLALLINFWSVLLILLNAQELPKNEKQTVTIIASLLAPFLSWWRKKRMGGDL
jgi:uncharacterized protein YybS (DUF2232 family)